MDMHDGTDWTDLTDEEKELRGEPGDLVSEEFVPGRPRASSVLVSLRVDRGTFDELGQLADERSETFSTVARDALRVYLDSSPGRRGYPEGAHSRAHLKVSESILRTWGDEALRDALREYEAACRAAQMRRNAWRSYVDYARRFLAWREGAYRPRGTSSRDRPVPRDGTATSELRDQARQYAHEVHEAGRAQPTVETYFRHAMFFIRWLEGDFQPGARLRGLR